MTTDKIALTCFESLASLAVRLDFHLGVSARKSILVGHERLNFKTDADIWAGWLNSVVSRLESITDISESERIWLRDEIAHDLGFASSIVGQNRSHS